MRKTWRCCRRGKELMAECLYTQWMGCTRSTRCNAAFVLQHSIQDTAKQTKPFTELHVSKFSWRQKSIRFSLADSRFKMSIKSDVSEMMDMELASKTSDFINHSSRLSARGNYWLHRVSSKHKKWKQISLCSFPTSKRTLPFGMVPRLSLSCPSDKSCIKMKMGVEHWYNDTDTGKTVPVLLCPLQIQN